MMRVLLTLVLVFSLKLVSASESNEITPYKFINREDIASYNIPSSSRFTTKRLDKNSSDIIYYLSKPSANNYPIAIMCGGSSTKDNIESIIHVHRYFLKEFLDLGAGVLTIEQWGVDGNKINEKEFMDHYTRSQRLKDHKTVIEHLKSNPPIGWNGKFIFFGISEGGPIVTSLTEDYPEISIATMNWSGAGDWSWHEELWVFIQQLLVENPECLHHIKLSDCHTCSEDIKFRERYDARMNIIMRNPNADQNFLGMSYKYHADALLYPLPDYKKISTPFLVVAGAQDTIIQSSDAFVQKAKNVGANITYLRVSDMDHYVRRRPDIIQKSFEWLKSCLQSTRGINH
jgi:pimeloyl-ACP methyl ester carboxylesterase